MLVRECPPASALHSTPLTPVPSRSTRRTASRSETRGVPSISIGLAPGVAALVDPQRDRCVVDVDEVGQRRRRRRRRRGCAWDRSRTGSAGCCAWRRACPSRRARGSASIRRCRRGPARCPAGRRRSCRPSLTRGSEKLTLGNASSARRSTWRVRGPALLGIVEEAFQAGAGAQRVGDAVAVEIDQPDLGILEVEARRLAVALERAPVPQAAEAAAGNSPPLPRLTTSRSVRPSPSASSSCTPGPPPDRSPRARSSFRAAGRSGRRRGCASSARCRSSPGRRAGRCRTGRPAPGRGWTSERAGRSTPCTWENFAPLRLEPRVAELQRRQRLASARRRDRRP